MYKQLLYGKEGRSFLLAGVKALATAVKSTLGPRGRNAVLYRRYDTPLMTKDGVTVAKEVELEDIREDAGAQIVKQVASRTADLAGDGTTTATVLAEAIFEKGLEAIDKGANPVALKRGIDKTIEAVCGKIDPKSGTRQAGWIDSISKPVIGDMIVQVGSISSNNDIEIGNIIADAMRKAGSDGVITVEESRTLDTSLEVVEGMQLNSGYISPYFINDPNRAECVLEKAYVLIHEAKLGSLASILPIMTKVAKIGGKLLILSEDVEGEAIAIMVMNKLQGKMDSVAVKAPGVGNFRKDLLGDIAALTGGKAIVLDLGISAEEIKLEDLGRVGKVIVSKTKTVLVNGNGKKEAVQERIKAIRSQLAQTENHYERDRLQERLAKLTGGVAIIKVGASSEVEMGEKKARVEDAMHATRAAVEEGVVAGGGVALARLSAKVGGIQLKGDELVGASIVAAAMLEPLRCIVSNAGLDPDEILSNVLAEANPNYGYNALTDVYEDLVVGGVLDPTKVVRTALQNAGSISGLMLTTETVIVDLPEVKDGPRMPGGKK